MFSGENVSFRDRSCPRFFGVGFFVSNRKIVWFEITNSKTPSQANPGQKHWFSPSRHPRQKQLMDVSPREPRKKNTLASLSNKKRPETDSMKILVV